jgi:hypothetical protein
MPSKLSCMSASETLSAASAAACPIELAHDVICPCIVVTAFTTTAGAACDVQMHRTVDQHQHISYRQYNVRYSSSGGAVAAV